MSCLRTQSYGSARARNQTACFEFSTLLTIRPPRQPLRNHDKVKKKSYLYRSTNQRRSETRSNNLQGNASHLSTRATERESSWSRYLLGLFEKKNTESCHRDGRHEVLPPINRQTELKHYMGKIAGSIFGFFLREKCAAAFHDYKEQ